MTDVASAMLAAQLLLVTLPKPGRLLFDGRVCLTEDHRCQTCGAPPGSVQYGKPMGWEHAADCAAHAQELEYAADLPRLVDAVQRIHARLASLLPAAEKLKEDLYMERQRSTGLNSQVISLGRELDRLRKALRIGIADDVSKALLSRIGEAVYAATAPILEAVEHGAQRINNGHHTAQKLVEDVKERLSFLTGRLPGTVWRWERRTLRARDYLAMEIERQGWDTSTGYLALQDMLDASDEYTFALRAIAESVGLPEDTDPLDDLDGLAERVKRCAERVAEAETVLTRVTPPHCEHSADAGHALGHGEHPDRGGPSLMDQEIERLSDQVRSLQAERDQLEETNGQLERDLLAVRRVPTKAQDGWYAVALVDARGSECASFHVEVPNGDRWDEVILAEATHHLSKRAVRGVLPLWAVAVPCKTDLCTVGVRLENVRMVLVIVRRWLDAAAVSRHNSAERVRTMTTRKVGDIFWSREPRPGHQGKEWAEFAIIGETTCSWEVSRDGRRYHTRKIPKNAPPSVDIAWTPEELAARRSEDAIASYVGRHTRRLFEAAQDFLRHISQETRLHGHSPQDLRTLCVLLGQPVDELDQILDEYNRHHPNT